MRIETFKFTRQYGADDVGVEGVVFLDRDGVPLPVAFDAFTDLDDAEAFIQWTLKKLGAMGLPARSAIEKVWRDKETVALLVEEWRVPGGPAHCQTCGHHFLGCNCAPEASQ